MTTPSGAISLDQVRRELRSVYNDTHGGYYEVDEYYDEPRFRDDEDPEIIAHPDPYRDFHKASLKGISMGDAAVRDLAGKRSGTISMSQLRAKETDVTVFVQNLRLELDSFVAAFTGEYIMIEIQEILTEDVNWSHVMWEFVDFKNIGDAWATPIATQDGLGFKLTKRLDSWDRGSIEHHANVTLYSSDHAPQRARVSFVIERIRGEQPDNEGNSSDSSGYDSSDPESS